MNPLDNIRILKLAFDLNNLKQIRVLASYYNGEASLLDESVFENATPKQRLWHDRMKEAAVAASFGGLPKYPEIKRLYYPQTEVDEYHIYLNGNFEPHYLNTNN